jgi:hypothetical protein
MLTNGGHLDILPSQGRDVLREIKLGKSRNMAAQEKAASNLFS